MSTGSGPRSDSRATFRSGGRQAGSARQGVRPLWTTIYLEEEVGTGLGEGEVLQRRLPARESSVIHQSLKTQTLHLVKMAPVAGDERFL